MAHMYGATVLTGGLEGALDAIDGVDLHDGDRALVCIPQGNPNPGIYMYILLEASGLPEAVPYTIAPVQNAGGKLWQMFWINQDMVVLHGAAYFAGGIVDTTSSPYGKQTQKLLFSTETTAAKATADLSQARGDLGAVSDGQTKGYFAGGVSRVSTDYTYFNLTDKITFASEVTSAQPSANLSVARAGAAGVSAGSAKGYIAGGHTGFSGSRYSTVDKVTYAADTTTVQTSASLSTPRGNAVGLSEGVSKGYIAGGSTDGGGYSVIADLITFSSDVTAAQTSANLSLARGELMGISNGSDKGYFSGGSTAGGETNVTDIVTYATDSTLAQTTSNLLTGWRAGAGVSEGATKGYVGGGATGGAGHSRVDKLTFATDVYSAQTTAALAIPSYYLAGLSTQAV